MKYSKQALVWFVYGDNAWHNEAIFSIVSAIAQTKTKQNFFHIFTDNPIPYQFLPVEIHPISKADLSEWNGPHNCFCRARHVAMKMMLMKFDSVVFIDSDTIFRKSPELLFERVYEKNLLCHKQPCKYGNGLGNRAPNLHASIVARNLADKNTSLLNAGVLGITKTDAVMFDYVIEIIDDLCPVSDNLYNLEEICVAFAARKRNISLTTCDDLIFHYWSRKKIFRAKISAWLDKYRDSPISNNALRDTSLVTENIPKSPALIRGLNKLLILPFSGKKRQFAKELLNGKGCKYLHNEFDRACANAWKEKAIENAKAAGIADKTIYSWQNEPYMKLIVKNI